MFWVGASATEKGERERKTKRGCTDRDGWGKSESIKFPISAVCNG